MQHRTLKTSTVMGMLLSIVLGTRVYAAPMGGQVVSGNSTINQGGNTTTINQKSQNTQINWQKFNVAKNETVNFVQPNKSAVALNKVVGNDASAIYGNLNANGQVFLVNPNGILFGKTASVNVGGLVASTLDIKANENGKYTFEGSGGTITNEGNLKANGNLVLAASIVNNQGTITNNSGTTQLVAADKITLDTGEAYTITVDKGALNAQINNGGAIYGNDGKVYLTAKGRDSLSNAVINHTGVIEANAVKTGAGGKIILLSDMSTGTTNVSGTLHAKGTTGDGGFIETSGAKVKIADSAKISTASEQGKYGTWLIDPKNFTIGSGLEDTETGISGTALGTKLASNNIEIKTVNDSGTEDGDIFVNDAITWDAATELKLNAFRNIEINNPITATTGSVALYYGQGAADGKINGTEATYTINMVNGYNPGNGVINLSAGNNFSTKLGSDGAVKTYTVITALGSAGDESKDTTNSLQGLANSGKLSGNYVLGADVDASDTATWNSSAGFVPIGKDTKNFTGTFDGLGHTISGLTINRPTTEEVGLFGYATNADISNVGMVGGSITGQGSVGGLVGYQKSGSIENAYATGEVTGTGNYVGGLVGRQNGDITNGFATGNVTADGQAIGGLVGSQGGSITNAYATGAVEGSGSSSNYAGGLVGIQYFDCNITNSYATGAVTSVNGGVGGLVGLEMGSITNSYATGAVSSTTDVGGLVGNQGGNITNSYATGEVSGTDYVGGLVGSQNSGSIENAYATGAVTNTGDYSGGLVGYQNSGSIENVYATGEVKGTGDYVGGLVGQQNGGSITNAYWDIITTNQPNAIGGTPKGTASTKQVSFSGKNGVASAFAQDSYQISDTEQFDFTNTWYIVEGESRPMLRTFAATKASDGKYHITNLNELQGMATDLAGNYVLDNDIDASVTAASVKNSNKADVWGGKGFATIGTYYKNFTGSLDGQGHGINSLTINRDDWNYVGLFGYISSSSIKNVSLKNVDITGSQYTGSLAGFVFGGTIEGVSASGNVYGADFVGGLFGENISAIDQFYSTCTVEGEACVGGLAGWQFSGSIKNSYATGAVNGTEQVGGLIGKSSMSSLTNSYAAGKVSGESSVGGLIGKIESSEGITSSYWDKTVNSDSKYDNGLGTGKTTKELQTASTFADWSIDKTGGQDMVWRIYEGNTSPLLKVFLKTMTVTADVSNNNVTYNGERQRADVSNIKYNGSTTKDAEIKGSISTAGGQGTNAGTYAITMSGLYSTQDGYDIVNEGLGDLIINKADLTLSGTRVYDGTTVIAGGALTATGVNNETFTMTGSGSTSNLSSKNAQENSKLSSIEGLALGTSTNGGLAANYNALSETYATNSEITITPIEITTVSGITAGDKTYDGTTNAALVLTGAALTGNIDGANLTVSSATGNFATKDAGTDKTVSITDIQLGGSEAINYIIKDTTTATATANINKANLTLSGNRVYDGTTVIAGDVLTATGVNNETFNITGSGSTSNLSSKNVQENSKLSSIEGLALGTSTNGGLAANYNALSETYAANSAITITPREITTVSGITAGDKTYDGTTTASLVTTGTGIGFTGMITDDDLSVKTATGTFADKNVGPGKTVSITDITLGGDDAGNYILTNATAADTANISAREITAVTGITANDKTYDGNTKADLVTTGAGIGFTGIVDGEKLMVLTANGAFANKNAGVGKTVSISGITIGAGEGTDINNYTLKTSAATATTTATINKATISAVTGITANDKTYDGNATADLVTTGTGIGFTGMITKDDLSVKTATGTFDNKNVGIGKTVSITGITLGGNDAGNYILTNATAADTANISAREITAVTGITANDKTYDGNTKADLVTTGAGIGFTGIVDGEKLTVLTADGAFADKNAGKDKNVSISGITIGAGEGTDINNYTLKTSATTATTTATIAKKDLTLTAVTANKEYDGTTKSTEKVIVDGLIDTDNITGLTQAYDSKNVMGNNGSTLRVLNSYTILDTDSKDMSGNYAITANTASGTITPKVITGITGLATNDKTYDGTTAVQLNTTNAKLGGVVSGDDLVLASATGTYATKNAGDNIGVSVGNIVLGGTDAGNYAVTSATDLPELIGSISKGSLYVIADDIERSSGIPFSFNGTEFKASGLASGETVSYVALNSDGADISATQGTYPINISGAKGSFAAANYDITYINGIMTVRPMESFKFAAAYPMQTISRHSKDDTLYGNKAKAYSLDYLRKREVKEALPTITVIGTGINTGNV